MMMTGGEERNKERHTILTRQREARSLEELCSLASTCCKTEVSRASTRVRKARFARREKRMREENAVVVCLLLFLAVCVVCCGSRG